MTFRVYDSEGNDVTGERAWFLGSNGTLYYLTDDVGSPLMEDEDHWFAFD